MNINVTNLPSFKVTIIPYTGRNKNMTNDTLDAWVGINYHDASRGGNVLLPISYSESFGCDVHELTNTCNCFFYNPFGDVFARVYESRMEVLDFIPVNWYRVLQVVALTGYKFKYKLEPGDINKLSILGDEDLINACKKGDTSPPVDVIVKPI
jgi:hypothetical protein